MNIEKYKIGQQVAICGFIEEINIENLRDIENTTHLVINTLTRTIDANLKYETVIIDPTSLKPLVPQYVANWYEEHKDEFYENLHCLLWEVTKNPDKTDLVYLHSISDDFRSWYIQNYSKDALQILVNMHQHGYYVKKEPRYRVTFKGLNINKHLCCNWTRENWYLWCEKESKMRHTSHTREELESNGFGWVFNCEGVEVEEVEE